MNESIDFPLFDIPFRRRYSGGKYMFLFSLQILSSVCCEAEIYICIIKKGQNLHHSLASILTWNIQVEPNDMSQRIFFFTVCVYFLLIQNCFIRAIMILNMMNTFVKLYCYIILQFFSLMPLVSAKKLVWKGMDLNSTSQCTV